MTYKAKQARLCLHPMIAPASGAAPMIWLPRDGRLQFTTYGFSGTIPFTQDGWPLAIWVAGALIVLNPKPITAVAIPTTATVRARADVHMLFPVLLDLIVRTRSLLVVSTRSR